MNKVVKVVIFLFLFFFYIPVYALTDTASSTVVIDNESQRILYEKNKDEQRLIASITKVMTAVVAIENKNLDDIVTIGEEILPMYGSNIYIEVGEKMSLRNLLYGLILRSGNDAAVAIATYVGKTEENFVKMMNKKAQDLGMKNTVFKNSHGLDDNEEKNYSTAYDMAILSSYANTLIDFCEISSTKKWTVSTGEKTYIWYNRNKLLNEYEYSTGGKTGYTPKAGRTLITTANKDNLNLTTVTLNDDNMYDTHKSLYNYIFSKYKRVKIIDKDNIDLKIANSYIKNNFYYPLTEKEKKQIKIVITPYEKEQDEKTGEITVLLNEKEIYRDYIFKRKTQKKKEGILSKLKKYIKELFNI